MEEIMEKPAGIPESEPIPSRSILRRYLKKVLFLLKWAALGFFATTFLAVVLFSFINPPLTPLMLKRAFIKKNDGTRVGIHKDWVSYKNISPYMIRAVVASEDNRFLEHWGIDMEAVQKAVDYNKRHRRKRGASTISQQVAKNVFLWPARTYIRKGFELYFTVLIETVWSKKRIMVVYLNVMETGNGLYGVEAAAQKYFHKSARKLTKGEAALIAAALPNPRGRNPARPSAYLLKRQARIINLMNKIGPVNF
ncbi:MAG: monofunctional biosynthetic peptidoglycan transglycosylase [Prolixibacteraceae bacterium]|nr:monofunctional biosynthetic peptidoglycan transglycosylase [Prolixibacteraceae bacterium]